MNSKTVFKTPQDIADFSAVIFPINGELSQPQWAAKFLFMTVATLIYLEPNSRQIVSVEDILDRVSFYREAVSCHSKLDAVVLKSPRIVGDLYRTFLQQVSYKDKDTGVHITLRYEDVFIYLEKTLGRYVNETNNNFKEN